MRFIDWSSLHYHLLWAYEGPAPVTALSGSYTDCDTSCWLITQGCVTLKTPRQKAVKAHAGEWAFVASPTRHQEFSKDAALLSLHFQLTWPGSEAVIDRRRNRIVAAEKIPELEKAGRRLVRALARSFPSAGAFLPAVHCDYNLYLKVQALLPSLLNAYLDAQSMIGNPPLLRSGRDERVLHVTTAIDRMPLNEPLSLAVMSKSLGLSRSYIDTLFTTQMGMTPKKYLERRRLRTAEQMLHTSERSVKEIAVELGFRHASHFCMWFKRLTGQRPSSLREAAGK